MGFDIVQMDSALESCRRVHAEDIILGTNMSMASQSEGKSVEKFLKPFHRLLNDEESENESDLNKFLALFDKHHIK